MAKEIFIHEWNAQDLDGRKDHSMKSEGTINGEHVYACKCLSTWFRLGKYIIKHDHANYLLGLTELMSRHEFKDNVKWWDWDKETNTGKYVCCVNEIVKLVNRFFYGDEYIKTLLNLQEELVGYEKCFYICACYRLYFDYRLFLKNKDAYQAVLEDFVESEHEKLIRETYPQYSETAEYSEGDGVLYEDRLHLFHKGRFVRMPKAISPLEIEAMRNVLKTIENEPDTDEKFVSLEIYGFVKI